MEDTDHPQSPGDEAPPAPAPATPGPVPLPEAGSAFDVLMVTPEEAERNAAPVGEVPPGALKLGAVEYLACNTAPVGEVPPESPPEEPDGPLLAEEVAKIEKAIDRLARRGLNLRAVIALLHDANPSIPKKHIKRVLEGLRELPALYGREAGKM